MQTNNKTLENWMAFAKQQTVGRHGMFAPRLSLWQELCADDFSTRKICSAAELPPMSFSCDIKGLDTSCIAVHNGFVTGERGKNLLFAEKKAGLGALPCVCRLSDLTEAQDLEKLHRYFKAPEPGVMEQTDRTTLVRDTAGFAKGGKNFETEQIKRLNAGCRQDTLVVYLPAGCRLEKPLQIINLCHDKESLFVQPHCLILLEKGASASIVHCTDSHMQSDILANALTEVQLEADSRLEYIQMQNVGDLCKIFHHIDANLQQKARLSLHRITLNGGLSQNSTEINLLEPEADAQVFGLYLQDRKQRIDNTVKINHFAPRTRSRELFKGVMDDSSEASFKGHVFVSPQAQQTEAYQTCRNLQVSPKAQAYAKPWLEIYADDVQCNHGVTVGQLDEEALFYMRCRGISTDMARRLLMRAYADEILREIHVEELRLWLTSLVKQRFSGQLHACQDCALACSGSQC